MVTPARDAQEKFITQYFSDLGSALDGGNFIDPVLGYAPSSTRDPGSTITS